MRKTIFIVILLLTLNLFLNAEEPHFMKDPAISPDGKSAAFIFNNNIWKVPFDGGEAVRLTSTPGWKRDLIYSKDGQHLAFLSNKSGYNALYIISSNGGTAKKISADPADLCSWYKDNKHLLVKVKQPGLDYYYAKLSIEDGSYEIITKYAGKFSKLSPNENKIIYNRFGLPYREKYDGSKNGELWEYDISKKKYTKLTNSKLTERYPVYSFKKNKIYFAYSDGEVFQISSVENYNFDSYHKLTNFPNWSVRDISIAVENDNMVFENFDKIGFYNAKTKKFGTIKIEIKEDFRENPLVWKNVRNKADQFTISKDGKLIVFTYKYDLFAVPEKGGEVKQLTFDQGGIDEILIMNNNKTIFFTSYQDGKDTLFRMNIRNPEKIEIVDYFQDYTINSLEKTDDNRLIVKYSAWKKKKMAAYSEKGNFKKFTQIGDFENIDSISNSDPTGKYLLFTQTYYKNWTRTLFLYDFKSKKARKIFSRENYTGNVEWIDKGKSAVLNNGSNLIRLDIEPKKAFPQKEDHWDDVFNSTSNVTEKDSADFDLRNIENRFETIVKKEGWNSFLTKDEDNIYYYNKNNGKVSIRKCNFFGKDDTLVKKLGNNTKSIQFLEKDKTFYILNKYGISKLSEKSSPKLLKFSFDYKYDKIKLRRDLFKHIWSKFGRGFYDPEMHGMDWDKLYEKYEKYRKKIHYPSDLENIVEEMIGELDASHTGYYPKEESSLPTYRRAYLGAEFNLEERPEKGIYLKTIYEDSKLFQPYNIKKNSLLLKINDKPIFKNTSLAELLFNKIDKPVKLTFAEKDSTQTYEIRGLSYGEQYTMHYKHWVKERKDKVKKLTDSDIGYLHIRRMKNEYLEQFKQEMYAEMYNKEGIIIDVRDNGGGHIADDLMEILTEKTYGYDKYRYTGSKMKRKPNNFQEIPKVLLINEGSFSNAEIFSHFFELMGTGTIIGMPTSGSVIGTSSVYFMDGSHMRMPRVGRYCLKDGKIVNMEGNGAKPDIRVDMLPEQIINDDDVQLEKAVEVLLEKIK